MSRIDAFQRRHVTTAVAIATVKRFSAQKSTNLASMIAFWGFFSIFPLLMVLVSVLGWILPTAEKNEVLAHVAEMFPLLDPRSVKGLSGSWWALLVGMLTTLWSGIAVVRTTQTAFSSVWETPSKRRPSLRAQVLRSVLLLAAIGLGLLLSSLISGFVTSAAPGVSLGPAGRIVGYLIALALDVALLLAAFATLSRREATVREVLPGALLSSIVFFLLEQLSAFIIARHLHSAESTYGRFATVITILWWFYLQANVTMLGAQLNVVLKRHLHPRSLSAQIRAAPAHREDEHASRGG